MTASLRTALAALAACLAFGSAAAQDSASRPLQLVVPYGPGNGLDLLAREFAEVLRSHAGAPVLVENREGAGGVIGTSYTARAAPDGQTLLFTAHPPFASAPLTQNTPAYDPLTSFVPVARLGSVPLVAITSVRSPFATFQQMKEFVVANADKATYAHSGNGSPGQLYTELMKQAAQLPGLRAIPYRSTGQAITDVIAGVVLVSLVSYPAAAPHLKAGTVRMLAVGSLQRMKEFPEVPTLAEALAQPGFEAGVWYGVLAPAGTPAERVNRLHEDIARALSTPSITGFMARSSITPQLMTPAEFRAALRSDVEVARRMVAATQSGDR